MRDATSKSSPPDVAAPAAAAVFVADATGRLAEPDRGWVARQLGSCLGHLAAGGEVRVRVVDDAAMDAAHRRYCNIPGTTDVLTFDLRDAQQGAGGASADPLDTDLLVCLDEAVRAAAARGHEVRRELLLYSLHGVLHCLGEDDHDDAAAARMHAREDAVLEAIGVGRVYAGGVAGERGHG